MCNEQSILRLCLRISFKVMYASWMHNSVNLHLLISVLLARCFLCDFHQFKLFVVC